MREISSSHLQHAIKSESAHQYDIGDDRPGKIQGDHAEENEDVCEGGVAVHGDERQVHEGRRGEEREPADEGVAVLHAGSQSLGHCRPQRDTQRAREHAHQPELVRHAVVGSSANFYSWHSIMYYLTIQLQYQKKKLY